MRHAVVGLSVITVLASGSAAAAQERTYTRALTCSAVKGIVVREHDAVLATNETSYELVHNSAMPCTSDETGAPAYVPTSDEANCFAGWRCKQRGSDGPSK